MRVKAHIHHETGAHNDNRVSIRRRLRHFCACNVTAGARSVIDVELLTKGYRKSFSDDACDHVGWPASREADHHSHRMVGVMSY